MSVGLPTPVFLFTLDQVAGMLAMDVKVLKASYLHFHGLRGGLPAHKSRMTTYNIAPEGEPAEWRIAERELIRWLRHKKINLYRR